MSKSYQLLSTNPKCAIYMVIYYKVSILKFLPTLFINLDVFFYSYFLNQWSFFCFIATKLSTKVCGLDLSSFWFLHMKYWDREVFKTFLCLCSLSLWWFCKSAGNFKFILRFCVRSVLSCLFRVWNTTVGYSECFLSAWIEVLIHLSIILIVKEMWETNSASNIVQVLAYSVKEANELPQK